MITETYRNGSEPEITPEMIEAGMAALDDWVSRYGVDDVPAAEELVRMVLLRSLSQAR